MSRISNIKIIIDDQNSLLENIIISPSLNRFKSRIDNHWAKDCCILPLNMNKVIPKSGNKIEICSHSTNSLEQNNIRQQRISPVHDDGDDDDDDNDDMVT